MGQCMSRKAAGAFAASAAVSQNRPSKMQKNQKLQSPDDENNKPRPQLITQDTNKQQQRLIQTTPTGTSAATKGVAMSFGFRRRTPAPSVAANATAARRLASNVTITDINCTSDTYDKNGNDSRDTDALTSNVAPTGRSTPKLVPPKKEANATKVSRFGFRHTQNSRLNKVADVNSTTEMANQNKNNNFVKKPIALIKPVMPTDNNNRNRMYKEPSAQVGKFTMSTTQLPRPEPVRLIETKTAKTLANNNKREAVLYQHNLEETSSKDGSLTEDSGVGSHLSSYVGETEVIVRDSSPTFGGRRRRNSHHKPRNLEVVVTGCKTFDVRDLDDSNDSCDSVTAPPLPQLPNAFHSTPENKNISYHSSGIVRDRTVEYQRNLDRNNRMRKISKTSSEGFSDDYGEEEKTYRDLFRSEKTFVKTSSSQPTFFKSRTNQLKGGDSSPTSSDEQEWAGGEAMADDVSFSISSSDESKDKINEGDETTLSVSPVSKAVIGSALQSLISSSLSKSFNPSASKEVRNVMLTIEDPKFAAVAAASNSGSLLDDETLLSPVDSIISCSETEELRRKLNRSSSNSKDINEKLTPPSPGTPTNASNSLSTSDDNDNLNHSGKDDFLIDDEIADQPALIFEDRLISTNDNSSETMMESTPKPRRRIPSGIENSPLSTRNKRFSQNRTGSLDTLSPCDSITSDDLMMDFAYSQSSGLDECDIQSSGYPSLNETLIQREKEETLEAYKGARDWSSISMTEVSNGPEKRKKSTSSRTRLLSSRVSTPNSTVDSPKSLVRVSRLSAASSPVRHGRVANLSSACGYDSDGSVRLDRASHTAIKQDIVGIKTMLLKLRRVLNETVEEELLRSETHNPFETQHLTNGIFNSLGPDNDASFSDDNNPNAESKVMSEVADLRRQVLFLQGQLEDREKTVQTLEEKVVRLAEDNYHANSAPASTTCESQTCNAATQTERIRPISAGPSLLNGSPVDGSTGSLVSATESPLTAQSLINSRRSRPPVQSADSTVAKRTPSRLWRQPGEPPSPQRYASSSIPKRANSRTRTPASTS